MSKKHEINKNDIGILKKENNEKGNYDYELKELSNDELIERIKKLEELLSSEIKKRDEIIEDLKKKNELLLKTALKQSMKNEELKALFERFKKTEKEQKNS
ncbi:MAG: hypothetical protein QXU20_04115 [Candidatus Woesearchaeota archaeon]